MTEVSPPKLENSAEGGRIVATGALRRVFKSRENARSKRPLDLRLSAEHDGSGSESDGDDNDAKLHARNTSNHYTLNLPSAPAVKSDTPYILLGYVHIRIFLQLISHCIPSYLQFFFNLSLVLLFLYLVLQFIFTVQRDVEQRISEYSMGTNELFRVSACAMLTSSKDIVQEISMCASQYKNNLCASNPIPAMNHQCATWETCMNRDPTIVGRAKVGAEMIAEVVNGFVEPISWKTLVRVVTVAFLMPFALNIIVSSGVHADLTLLLNRVHQHFIVVVSRSA